MKKILLTGLALVITCTSLSAQKTRKVQFRTFCPDPVKDLEKVMLEETDGKKTQSREITLFTDISPVVEATFKTDEAVFFTEKTGAGGKPERIVAGKASMGKSTRQMFLFMPGSGGEGKPPYQVIAWDDDVKSFAMGNVLAVNLTPMPLRFTLAGDVGPEIPAGGFARFPQSAKGNDYNMYPVQVEFRKEAGEWENGHSSNWKASPKRREIVVALMDPAAKELSVRIFSDFPPWVK